MTAYQSECSTLEQRSVIKLLMVEKCKPCEIYRRMCDAFGEICFSQKCAKSFKERQNSIDGEDRPERSTMTRYT